MRANSELIWLPLKAMGSVEEPVGVEDALLRYALLRSGGKDKHPQMLLVLGWWSLILFELSMYKLTIRCHQVSF